MIATDWQFAMDGFAFGVDTQIVVNKFDWSKPATRDGDKERPTADGTLFGRDWHDGAEISLDIDLDGGIVDAEESNVLDLLEQMRSVWYGDDHRNITGAVVELEYKMPGRESRKFYGRPREFEVADGLENVDSGLVTAVATFQCVDGYSYGLETSKDVQLRYPSSGGLAPPWTPPINISSFSDQQSGIVNVEGTRPAWCSGAILGPATNPRIQLVGDWYVQFDLSLGDLEFITLYANPWDQERYGAALLNGVTNVAGKVRRGSKQLSKLILPPGPNEFVYSAQDASGTSKWVPSWSPKFTSL